jgi:hypothetical protein
LCEEGLGFIEREVFLPQKSLADLSISVNFAKDPEFGWIVVDDRPDMLLEYRDETAWALLPLEMC